MGVARIEHVPGAARAYDQRPILGKPGAWNAHVASHLRRSQMRATYSGRCRMARHFQISQNGKARNLLLLIPLLLPPLLARHRGPGLSTSPLVLGGIREALNASAACLVAFAD
jgi:hypothetical protein